jgi:hypothetical protein
MQRPARRAIGRPLAVLVVLLALGVASAAAGPDGGAVARDAGPRDAGAAPVPDAGPAAPPDAGPTPPVVVSAPVVVPAPPPPAVVPPIRTTSAQAIKAVVGLLVIFALAYLLGHPAVVEFERRARLTQVITAGFPFLLLGLVARQPSVDILSPGVLRDIAPVLPFGLGWIGFAIGFRFDVRRLDLDDLPRGVGAALALTTVVPFAAIVAVASVLLLLDRGLDDGTFLRNAVVLGAAGVVGVRAATRALGDRLAMIVQLQEGCVIAALIVLGAFWRPAAPGGWQLPALAWIFLTLGLGLTLALVLYAVLGTFRSQHELMVLLIGSVGLSAGMASYLRLSPIAVCFIAAALLFNFPGDFKDQLRAVLARLERPIYLVFLTLAGALWRADDWRGWALLPLFVVARLLGKGLGMRAWRARALGEMSDEEQSRLTLAPMAALAIAVVVNAQDLYLGREVPWMVTTVIGGAILTEILVQVLARGRGRSTTLPPYPMTRPPTTPLTIPPAPDEAPP